ncbi:MAG: hypothetical protein HZB26_26090 [Candidatus Hydrogenedentes bacterium]|nr:hypothetical protein [Candidatus Hydrogenedentota bacterium]
MNSINDDPGYSASALGERIEIMLVCVAAVFVLLGTYDRSFGDTANSRLATVYSLSHYGTWFIDRPLDEKPIRFEQGTIDKVMVNGHVLSSKPPLLPLFMTGEYIILNKLFGYDLDKREDSDDLLRIMSMTFVGSAYLAAVFFSLLILRMFIADPLARLVTLFTIAFCTQMWGYSTNLNNHVPGAGLTVVAIYLALGLGSEKLAPTAWRFALFGLASGLVVTVDMPAAIFPFLGALYLLLKFPRQVLTWAALGAAIPIGLQSAILYSLTGSPLPVQTHKPFYLYESSYWRQPREIDALTEPKLTYLFHITLGRCGLFSLFPVLLLGVAAVIRCIARPKSPLRGAIITGALGFLVLTAYYLCSTNNYGGQAYGFRWFICAMPVLALMGAPVLSTIRSRWKWVFLCVMIGISFYSSWESTKDPWAANHQWTCRFLGKSY